MSRIPCRHFVWLARLSIFTHADILVLVSEFVVVVILSTEWMVCSVCLQSLQGHLSSTTLVYSIVGGTCVMCTVQ